MSELIVPADLQEYLTTSDYAKWSLKQYSGLKVWHDNIPRLFNKELQQVAVCQYKGDHWRIVYLSKAGEEKEDFIRGSWNDVIKRARELTGVVDESRPKF